MLMDPHTYARELACMMKWFDRFLTDDLPYRYFPELSKTVLIVQSSDLQKTDDLFHDLGASILF